MRPRCGAWRHKNVSPGKAECRASQAYSQTGPRGGLCHHRLSSVCPPMVAEMIGYPQGIQGGGQKDRYQHRYEISGKSASAASTRTWQLITSAVHTWTNLRSTQAEMILHHPCVTVCGLLDRWKDAVGTLRAPCSCQRIFIRLLQGVAFRSNSEQEGAASRRLE